VPDFTYKDSSGNDVQFTGGVLITTTVSGIPGSAEFGILPNKAIYYLPWLNRLTPDTIPTVSVTGIIPAVSSPTNPNPPPDGTGQLVTALNQTYTQVHALHTFNVATGMIYSGLRNYTFTRQESAPAVTCPQGATGCVASPERYATVSSQGARSVDPVLFFDVYLFGKFDAERKWHPWDLKPEPAVGISLSSPSTDYFFGLSSEVYRGVQIVGGIHEGKINKLVAPLVNDPTSSAAPTTTTYFHRSQFIGITFNISFIQSLFGGGGKGSN